MERMGWWFQNLNHHPVCACGAATPPGQEGQCVYLSQVFHCLTQLSEYSFDKRDGFHRNYRA